MDNEKSLELIKKLKIIIKEYQDEENIDKINYIKDKVINLEIEVEHLEKNDKISDVYSYQTEIINNKYNCLRYFLNFIHRIGKLIFR